MSIILYAALASFAYVLMGATVGIFLFKRYNSLDEVGSFLCGSCWPIALPILLAVYLATIIVASMTNKGGSTGWRSK
jgi:hypothetical protein